MAIPLIQNVEKQDINTSIIAIRRQLEQLYNALGVNENTVVTNNIGGSDNTPLGTIVSYLGTENPANGEWLICDGSTFDASKYPSLATFLGGNVLPEVFDHSRPSAIELLNEWSNSSSSGASSDHIFTAQYDGFIICHYKRTGQSSYAVPNLTVNNYTYTQDGSDEVMTLPIIADDTINYKVTTWSGTWNVRFEVQYYKSHKLIKAVSPTDQYTPPSTEMQQIEQYVDNGLQRNMSYSTTEQWTGGYWIDGKPIYRRVLLCTAQRRIDTQAWYDVQGWSVANAEIDKYIYVNPILPQAQKNANVLVNTTTKKIQFGSISSYFDLYIGDACIIEYTKSSD